MMRALIFILLALAGSNALAGYDLHITRKAFWADETGPAISAAEWTAYVAADAQVQRDPDNSENDFIVLIGAERFPLWFDLERGEAYTNSPSDQAITKLIDIAQRLDAQVQGDDGEPYPPHD